MKWRTHGSCVGSRLWALGSRKSIQTLALRLRSEALPKAWSLEPAENSPMRFRTWPVAALGLGSLLLLIVVSMLAASRRAQEIYTELDQLNTHHRDVERKLRRLRSDVHLSGIFVRDYLLDIERERAPEYRQRLAEFRQNNMATLAELRALATDVRDDERIAQPADAARRLLADVRSALRLDAGREDLPQRRLPAARGGAAARSGAGDRAGDRGAEQREPRRSAPRWRGGTPRSAAI